MPIDINKVHPLFDRILADHFFKEISHEDIDRTVKPSRAARNEDYYEYHESHEDLGERYNEGCGRRWNV